jgi:thiol-disulfide isomerase/thioredoxin
MKKTILSFLILAFIVGCAVRPTEKKVEKVLTLESDSLFKTQALSIMDDIESPELKYKVTDRLFPLVIAEDDKIYQSVLSSVKETHNAMQFSMLANSIAWQNRKNQMLEERLFRLMEEAAELCRTDSFIDALSVYLEKRGYAPVEKIEAEPQFKGMILDTYAYYLMNRDRVEDALLIYDEILAGYEDPEILINLSKAQASLNRYQHAMETILKALLLAPAHEEALSLIYEYGESLAYPASAIDSMVDETISDAREKVVAGLDRNRMNIPMPEFELEKLDGTQISSGDLKGKIVVIDFFATWCGPCRRALPRIHQLYKNYIHDDDVMFLIISTDEDRSKVKPFIDKNKYTFPVFYNNGVSDDFGIRGVPTMYVVDPEGIIRYKKAGYAEGEDLEYTLMMYINSVRK